MSTVGREGPPAESGDLVVDGDLGNEEIAALVSVLALQANQPRTVAAPSGPWRPIRADFDAPDWKGTSRSCAGS
ncbi:hypothetical protein BTM25_50240 [Actinomadura rubteroloni]|uniref:Uncharacterized protein n=1 Tax=Actinomadura rubteroloni TaxID=1926885 RepID=A0A2P4UCP3_9ACTN|nr:hypothetical protein BTM25_50240 [Actinomadura rubteroloni]